MSHNVPKGFLESSERWLYAKLEQQAERVFGDYNDADALTDEFVEQVKQKALEAIERGLQNMKDKNQ